MVEDLRGDDSKGDGDDASWDGEVVGDTWDSEDRRGGTFVSCVGLGERPRAAAVVAGSLKMLLTS